MKQKHEDFYLNVSALYSNKNRILCVLKYLILLYTHVHEQYIPFTVSNILFFTVISTDFNKM